MYAENEPAMKRKEAVLNHLPGELYTVDANDKYRRFSKVAEVKNLSKSNISS